MKTIFRNFLSVVRRFKTVATLNLLGLTVAFAAFLVIMAQVNYEWSFDRMHPEAGRIVRADLEEGSETMTIHSRALLDAILASSPHIETGALVNPFLGDIYVVTGEGERRRGFREPFVTCYPDVTRIFGFSFTEGEADCLNDPEKAIIPQSMARRLFGDSAALGQAIFVNEYLWTKEEPRTLTVGGVYRDFPGNTQLDNAVYTAIDRTMQGDWDASNFICYLLLDGQDPAEVEAGINERFDFSPIYNPNHVDMRIRLKPLSDIYLLDNDQFGIFKTGSANSIRVLSGVALLIILIAGVNFTNFSISLAPARLKSLNTQKILGASARSLRGGLVSEALATTFVAWLAALVVVHLLDRYRLLSFIEADLDLGQLPGLVLATGGIALATGLLAGLYPAWYVTSFQPAMALKGSLAFSRSGRALRNVLVGFQYVISTGLIVAAAFMQLQHTYMQTFNQGFDKDRIAIVELNGNLYRNSRDAYANGLKAHPDVEDVAFARQKMGARDNYSTYGLTHADREFYCYMLEVSPNFLQVMGIPVVQGRDFLPSDNQPGAELTYIFNRELQQEQQMEPGDLIGMGWGPGRTAGIVGDLKFTSLRREADRISFVVNPQQQLMPVSFIRFRAGANMREVVAHIRRTLAGIDPTYPFDIEFYDQVFHDLYRKEESMNRAVGLLSVLAIVISAMGVFGLVLFETQRRRKEIGVRKVYGASPGEILAMFGKAYLRTVCICFVVAAPAAWYAVGRWLENFAYRTPLHWWVFLLAFAIIGLVTLVAVGFQCRQAALANPTDSISSE